MNPCEERNFHSDHRVRAGEANNWFKSLDEKQMKATVEMDDEEVEVGFTWEVCPTCNGKGSHVNPSIDCCGLTGEDFAEDPEFADEYFSGVYDESCRQCGGKRVVPVCKDERVNQHIREQAEFDAQCRAEHEAERRMGA